MRILACVFDAYGTLLDVHAATRRHASRIGPAADAVSVLWRTKQLEYTWVRSLMGRHADFRAVTEEALDHALAVHKVAADASLRADLLASYRALDAFADARDTLCALRVAGLKTAILSNGTPDWLAAAAKAAKIDDRLDAIWSIESAGIYKPDPRVYRLATHGLGMAAADIGFVSSNPWDAAAAAANGFQAVRVNRTGGPAEYARIASLAEVAALADLPKHFGVG
ncbi:MAG: haloacid dehalogenase type II [Tagaea sp.]